jgi:chromosome segregation ATPase
MKTQADSNINKIVSFLASSKHSLDKALEKAKEYQDCDKDLKFYREDLEHELDLLNSKDEDGSQEVVDEAKRRLERVEADHILLASELAILCKTLEDDLSYAGRVSDHFNGKVYPLGMKPL